MGMTPAPAFYGPGKAEGRAYHLYWFTALASVQFLLPGFV